MFIVRARSSNPVLPHLITSQNNSVQLLRGSIARSTPSSFQSVTYQVSSKPKDTRWINNLLGWTLWLPVGLVFIDRGYSLVRINGMSMQPTFNPDSSCLRRDVVILNRFTDKFKRGDVITVYHPVHPTLTLTKRIIGLEGDIVKPIQPHKDRFVRIPPGHCWVEGDESFHSQDSNTFGPIPMGLISGRVEFIVYPFSRFGTVSHTLPNSQNKRALPRKFT